MGKVGIIGVGQSAFVRGYPGSIRELALEGFKDASWNMPPLALGMTCLTQ